MFGRALSSVVLQQRRLAIVVNDERDGVPVKEQPHLPANNVFAGRRDDTIMHLCRCAVPYHQHRRDDRLPCAQIIVSDGRDQRPPLKAVRILHTAQNRDLREHHALLPLDACCLDVGTPAW